MDDAKLLAATLLWLRNHYDVADRADEKLKRQVLERVDAVLELRQPTAADMAQFRKLWSKKKG